MRKLALLALLFFALDCSDGDLGAPCKPDGTCRVSGLECRYTYANNGCGPMWACVPRGQASP